MSLCSLCASLVPKNGVTEGEKAFCCSGCLMVYQIIGAEENYRGHPLFQEALKAGVISNSTLLPTEEKKESKKGEIKFHLHIEEMWCPACADALHLILMKQKGICGCVVDYATDLAVITIDPFLLSKEQVVVWIEKLGYRSSELFSKEKREVSRSLWLRFAVAAFCAMNIMMLSYPLYAAHFGTPTDGYDLSLGWLSFFLALPLISYAAWPIWKRLTVSFKSGLFGMETLVLIGVASAFSLSFYNLLHHDSTHLYFDSMSMVLSFILFGKILEKKAKFSAKETFLRLTRSLPKKGYKRLESGRYAYVPIKEIVCGDLLLVRTGEKVVLDGEIIEGEGVVDEAVMTGEAIPVQKIKGCSVVGGSVVKQGSFLYRVTKDQERSLLGQIVHLIEHDLDQKNVTSTLVDQITRFFVPLVLALASLSCFLFGPIRALTILLISCPCALGIAAPLAQSRLLFRFAEKGGLVRNRNRLSLLAKSPLFVFDKTGTLTEGKFSVLKGLEGLTEEHLAILKSLASHSNHPISSAISSFLSCTGVSLESVKEIIGRGMEGKFQGKNYLLGSESFLLERDLQIPLKSLLDEITVIYFVENKTLLTQIHLGDRLRAHLPKVEGVILSGDAPHLVEAIAKKCGFLWGRGGMNPLQKREEIIRLKQKGSPVVMVGDGVNDAPAMTVADLGISVVSASDLAVEVSDILLTTDHLDALPTFCTLVQKAQRIIYQNLFWAFFYNAVGIVLACFGLLNPLFAAAAMAISSLCVTLNSLRI